MSTQLNNSDFFLRRIQIHQRVTPAIILQYDPPSRDLRVWFWPVTEAGTRVVPSDLLQYRVNHDFRTPCCLCACNANGFAVTESAIYAAVDGAYSGEYVAGCALNSCGYLVGLERLYPKRGLLLRKYPVRSSGSNAAEMTLRTSEKNSGAEDVFPLVFRMGDERAARLFESIATYERPVRNPETPLDRLLRLDSWTRPGLSEAEFNRLFAKCHCGLVMTRRVFRNHVCARAAAVVRNPPVVIDLTSDDDSGVGSHVIIDLTADEDEQ